MKELNCKVKKVLAYFYLYFTFVVWSVCLLIFCLALGELFYQLIFTGIFIGYVLINHLFLNRIIPHKILLIFEILILTNLPIYIICMFLSMLFGA